MFESPSRCIGTRRRIECNAGIQFYDKWPMQLNQVCNVYSRRPQHVVIIFLGQWDQIPTIRDSDRLFPSKLISLCLVP